MGAAEPDPGPRKCFFPYANHRYCILEPLKKGRMMIGLADDAPSLLSKEWVEVDEDSAQVVLMAKVDEDQVLAKYVGEGGMWINHRPIKKNVIYAMHEGDILQLKSDGPLYTVCFVKPRELISVTSESFQQTMTDKPGTESSGKTARFG